MLRRRGPGTTESHYSRHQTDTPLLDAHASGFPNSDAGQNNPSLRFREAFSRPNRAVSRYSGNFCSPCTENEASAPGAALPGCPPPTLTR